MRGMGGGISATTSGNIYARISEELAGGRPLQYIGKTGQITSTHPGGIPGTSTSTLTATGAGGATAVTGGSDIMELYAAALERLSTGGMALEASLADIEEGKRQAIAGGQQALVSGGLAGTTVMGGVPVAAEKTAGRARLAARGEAESKYLTALTSYAAFAERAREAAAERSAAMERLKLQIESQERLAEQSRFYGGGTPTYIPESERYAGGAGPGIAYGSSLSPNIERIMTSMGPSTASRYSSRFPSIYGETEEPVPNWIQ